MKRQDHVSLAGLTVTAAITVVSEAALRRGGVGAVRRHSTLDGKTLLPARITGTRTRPSTKLVQIEFLVDGKLRGRETSPYRYGDKGERSDTVDRATRHLVAHAGARIASAPVRPRRTDASPRTPWSRGLLLPRRRRPTLAGKWQRTVDPTEPPGPGRPALRRNTRRPAGTYTLVFDRRWIRPATPARSRTRSVDKNTGSGTSRTATTHRARPRSTSGVRSAGGCQRYSPRRAPGVSPGAGPKHVPLVGGRQQPLTLSPVGGLDPCRVRGFIWTATGQGSVAGESPCARGAVCPEAAPRSTRGTCATIATCPRPAIATRCDLDALPALAGCGQRSVSRRSRSRERLRRRVRRPVDAERHPGVVRGLEPARRGFVLRGSPAKEWEPCACGGCAWFVLRWTKPGKDSPLCSRSVSSPRASRPRSSSRGARLSRRQAPRADRARRRRLDLPHHRARTGLGVALVFEPRLAECAQCPANLLVAYHRRGSPAI